MRHHIIVTILILISFQIYGQSEKISTSELDSLYVNTIQSQYFFLLNGTIYVERNQNIDRIKDIEDLNYLVFMTDDELIQESLKKKKIIKVIRVNHRLISQDTIDINISYLDVKAKRVLHFNNGLRFKKADFKLSCGGTKGYQPTCRFIYNATKDNWIKLINNK